MESRVSMIHSETIRVYIEAILWVTPEKPTAQTGYAGISLVGQRRYEVHHLTHV